MPERLHDTWWPDALINLPLSVIDAYVFCAVWHLCILDRNMQAEEDSDPYDF